MTVGERCLHYRLTEMVDRSLTGTLLRAHHERTGQEILIHRLDGILLSGGTISSESLVGSSKSLLRLRHANIAPVIEVDEEDGIPFLALGDPPGAILPDWDSPQRAAGAAERVSVMLGVAKGLLHAHQQGILHRDFRPGSVKVAASGAARVRGFIPARLKLDLRSLLKDEGFVPGSLDYLSPEHLTGLDLDFRSDIFSFGVVLYELLAGRHPFRAANDTGTANRILSTEADPVGGFCSDLPDRFAEVIDKAIRKEPEDRQQSFKEMVGALADVLPELRQRRNASPARPAESPTPNPTPASKAPPASAPEPAPAPVEEVPAPAVNEQAPSGKTITNDLSRIKAALSKPPPKPPVAGVKTVQRLTAGLPPNLKTSSPYRQVRPAAITKPAKKPASAGAQPEADSPAVEKTPIKPAAAAPVKAKREEPTKAVAAPALTLGLEQPRERRVWLPVAAVLAIALLGGGFWYFGLRTDSAETPAPLVQPPVAAVSAPEQPPEPSASGVDVESALPTPSPVPVAPPPAPEEQAATLVEEQVPFASPEPVRPAPRPWTEPVRIDSAGQPPPTAIISSEPPPIAVPSTAPAGVVGNLAGQSLAVPPPPPVKPPPRIGGRIEPPKLVFQRPPMYPATARTARIAGIVRLQAHVDVNGNVESVTYVDGPRMLARAAIDAVKKWRYEPATLNGKAVAVDTDVQLNFTLK